MLKTTSLRVLVAEDDAAIHEEIKVLVKQLGFTVVGDAYNGVQAVTLAEQLKPDVILLDIVMPDPESGREDKRAGFYATEAILRQCPTPIIWLTAYETQQMIAEAGQLGVSAYLVKPPQASDLSRAIALAHARFADMLELRRLNAALQQALDDKDVLMKELKHRVKNSLFLAASLLGLEERNLPDDRTRNIFSNAQARICSIAEVYEQLYEADEVSQVNLRRYIEVLAAGLSRLYLTPDGPVRLELQLEEMQLDTKRALPLGIILNELITNALKYAFPVERLQRGEPGLIRVELTQADGQAQLCVADNGAGEQSAKAAAASSGLGAKLIAMFTRQIGGNLTTENENGYTVRISFKLEQTPPAGV